MRRLPLTLTLLTTTALAAPTLGVRAQAGAALALSRPQAERFGAGVDLWATPFLQLHPLFDVHVTTGLTVLAGGPLQADAKAGGLFSVLVGARVKGPMREKLVSPWFDLSVGPGYAGTGHLVVAGAAGVSMRGDEAWPLWLGVHARMQYVPRGVEVPGFQSVDLSLLSLGVSVEFFPGSVETDHDHDGVLDADDACPQQFAETADGCPPVPVVEAPAPKPEMVVCEGTVDEAGRCVVPRVRVTKERLELDEKILFAFGTTQILPRSEPLLAAVARTLTERPELNVRIEGHADAKGSSTFNLELSEGRARAVRDFLVKEGVAASRLSTKGYGAQLPRDDNRSADGRDNNRRVEFVLVDGGGDL
jgi:outer membrane protein OmpA-like peptidoglycan-associated protein